MNNDFTMCFKVIWFNIYIKNQFIDYLDNSIQSQQG